MTRDVDPAFGGALASDDRIRTGVTGLATALAAVAGWSLLGTAGTLVGGALVATWLVAPPVYVVALGTLLVAAVLGDDASLVTVAALALPLAIVVLADVVDASAPVRTLTAGLVGLAGFTALVGAGLAGLDARWQVAALVVAVGTAVGYGLHRYTVVIAEATYEN